MPEQSKTLTMEILPQPTEDTCGPTSLHAVYRFHGERISLERCVSEVQMLETGGTLAVMLGLHALKRGYSVKIHTYNLEVFDPTWFLDGEPRPGLEEKLRIQKRHKRGKRRLVSATDAYLEYLELGGEVLFEVLRPKLITKYLHAGTPIIAGLSATYLYQEARELENCTPDDIEGDPSGHFVVLCGYDSEDREVLVADPLPPNPSRPNQKYHIPVERVICSILLGILTYDSNMLIITPPAEGKSRKNGSDLLRR